MDQALSVQITSVSTWDVSDIKWTGCRLHSEEQRPLVQKCTELEVFYYLDTRILKTTSLQVDQDFCFIKFNSSLGPGCLCAKAVGILKSSVLQEKQDI